MEDLQSAAYIRTVISTIHDINKQDVSLLRKETEAVVCVV